ncbi:DNA replication licensing factor MCM3 [Fistulifera solaris]|uniref:DNA replication licensing factor MCM3 n=1 Tax=Fistulifera solaris TaxID=1519565 RepID=A0A1Z5KIF9_FISSO|nr:DNA replication licensing factor MCM3 [Fistulifera solaris]|eukprot:GAX25831.1 DNA replication licensing factor MCM3 [Fistulifera solaris]
MGESYRDLVQRYTAFVENDRFQFGERIRTSASDYDALKRANPAAATGCVRVVFDAVELRSADDTSLWQEFRLDPLRHLRALERACVEAAEKEIPGGLKEEIKVSIKGPVDAAASSPRDLTSSTLRQLVCVEGVATKVSTIKPKVVKSVHYRPDNGSLTSREHVDATDPRLGLRDVDSSGQEIDRIVKITTGIYPTKDKDGNPLETEFGLSQYKDHQTITLQEMPEKAPMGQLPRSVELVMDHDLVDKVKPGDRVMIVGVYRALALGGQGQQSSSGVFRTVVLVNSVQILGRDANQMDIRTEDIRNIRGLAERPDILSVLGRSICPSIHGHAVIKKALALQLLSGVEKNLENGTHLRGDINILMVGDPSTAKSQLLRSAMTIAPLAVSTTGKGSSGVGLTAAITSDPETRERRLEAGAMVLADRGLVCIDEFDKMGESDRVAIHEAMEQQTVTISKAGIHASLNARCSVLAAANPVYGQYDRHRRIQENIGLPDSLLSRFDLLFVVLDQMDPETDRRIASHVIRGHRYRSGRGTSGHDSDYDDDDDEDDFFGRSEERVHSVWQRDRHYVEEQGSSHDEDPHDGDVLQHDFLRKYLYFAKHRIQPKLTEDAREFIAHRYAEMRARQDERTLPITARSLETVIRLATAHAKARLSETVESEPDCSAAMDILSFALYHENVSRKRTRETFSDETRNESSENEHNLRARVSDDENDAQSSDRQDPIHSVKDYIWERIEEQETVSVEDLEENAGVEQEVFQHALAQLIDESRILVSDGMAWRL